MASFFSSWILSSIGEVDLSTSRQSSVSKGYSPLTYQAERVFLFSFEQDRTLSNLFEVGEGLRLAEVLFKPGSLRKAIVLALKAFEIARVPLHGTC